MRKIFPGIFIISFILILNGCMQSDILITINQDGSGTLKTTTLYGEGMISMVSMMDKKQAKAMIKPKKRKLKKASAEMGEGVSLISVKKTSEGELKGSTVTYAFQDINKVKKLFDSSSIFPDQSGQDKEEEDCLTISYTAGNPAGLVIYTSYSFVQKIRESMAGQTKMPMVTEGSKERGMAGETAMDILTAMFGSMRFRLRVTVKGEIIKTDALYSKDNIITVMDLNFNKMMEDSKAFQQFNKIDFGNPDAAAMEMMAKSGFLVDPKEAITVKYK